MKKGFTLIEVYMVTFICLFLLTVLVTLLATARSSWHIAQVKSDLLLNGRKAMYEMSRELAETSSGTVQVFSFVDPINGEFKQGIWLACGRGSSTVAGEDGSPANDYLHLDPNNVASWRSVIIYGPYQTADGRQQLRRYVDFGQTIAYYSNANVFPLTFNALTNTTFTLDRADGTVLTIDRTGGRVLANYIDSEDANNNNSLDSNEDDGNINLPVDNADGVLNYGVNFIKNPGRVDIALFLSREATRLRQQGLILTLTMDNSVKTRQP